MSEIEKKPAAPMFHEEHLLNPPKREVDPLDVESLSQEELLDLLSRVTARLPLQLNDLDLEKELLIQYQHTRTLMHAVVTDSSTPANQRAQVANSCAAVLDQISKMQTRLYTAERLKAIEQALIKAVKAHMPEAGQAEFFDAYEKIYNQEEVNK